LPKQTAAAGFRGRARRLLDQTPMTLLADLRFALRSLKKAPLFTAVAVTSIALGVGANTAVFTLLDQVVLRLLPVKDARQIVQVSQSSFYGGKSGDGSEMSYGMFADLRDHNEVFAGMFGEFLVPVQVRIGDVASRVNGEMVSGTYFPVLGVQPALGRLLAPEDDRIGAGNQVVVLSHAFWKSRFSGDRRVVGQTLNVNGKPLTIVGVAQAGFDGLDVGAPVQVFAPIAIQGQMAPTWLHFEDRGFGWIRAFGRLKEGDTIEHAKVALQPLYKSILNGAESAQTGFVSTSPQAKKEYLDSELRLTSASSGKSGLRNSVEKPLWLLMAVVVGVLLIACANVANLLLARSGARQREVALRLALGASRTQIVQQLLVESVVLSLLGCFFGIVVATWGASFLLQFFADPDNALAVSANPDLRILGFTIVVSVMAALLFGLVPALQATKPMLAATLKNQAPNIGGGHPGLRKGLVVVQVALSLLLLVGAGLFLRSLNKLLQIDPGFVPEHLVAFNLDPALAGYPVDRSKQIATEIRQRLNGTPGVQAAAFAFFGVLQGGSWGMGLTIEGEHLNPSGRVFSLCNAVSTGYFDTMGTKLVAGRAFRDSDARTGPRTDGWPYRVAVVNETFVKRYFGTANPIGRRFGFGRNPGTPTTVEIVGVVKDALYTGVREEPTPQLFVPYLEANDVDALAFYVRTTLPPERVPALITRTVREFDAGLPITQLHTLDEQIAVSLTNERLVASLSSAFSALATLLAAVGLYGVMAYSVSRRTREIGIRVALGALTRDVVWRVMREAGVLVLAGLAIGLPAAWWLGRYVQSQLYNVQPGDPLTLTIAGVGLSLVAGLAALIPARRAAKIDPVSALRTE
jgi:predicted permease